MAYDASKRDDEEAGGKAPKPERNPYDSVLSGGGTSGTVAPTYDAPSRTGPAGPEMMNAGGPTATGHVNFDQIYNANAGVAQRESGKRAAAVEQAGQNAVKGRTGAQASFDTATRTGATQGPQSTDYEYASGQRNFYDPAQFVQAPTSGAAGVAAQRPGGAAPGGAQMMPEMTEDQFKGRLKQGAAGGYWGPDSLSSMSDYDKLLQETIAAQDLAKNPTTGMNQLDASLLNASGGKRFAELGEKYGGLQGELSKANAASVGRGKAAKADAGQAVDDYERLLGDYEATHQSPAGAAGDRKIGLGFDSGYGSYDDFKKGVGPGAGVHDFGTDLDPVSAIQNKLGENGLFGGNTVAEEFRKGVGAKDNLDDQNRMNAFKNIEKMYGPEAAKFLWEAMTQGVWDGMAGQNAGAIYKTLADLLDGSIANGGFKPPAPGTTGGRESETQLLGGADSADDPEAVRNGLAKGIPYTDANGKTWNSLSEWDAAHKEGA